MKLLIFYFQRGFDVKLIEFLFAEFSRCCRGLDPPLPYPLMIKIEYFWIVFQLLETLHSRNGFLRFSFSPVIFVFVCARTWVFISCCYSPFLPSASLCVCVCSKSLVRDKRVSLELFSASVALFSHIRLLIFFFFFLFFERDSIRTWGCLGLFAFGVRLYLFIGFLLLKETFHLHRFRVQKFSPFFKFEMHFPNGKCMQTVFVLYRRRCKKSATSHLATCLRNGNTSISCNRTAFSEFSQIWHFFDVDEFERVSRPLFF